MLAVIAAAAVTLLDLVEIELGYTTIAEQYYRKLDPQRLLDGARSGIVAYLRARGIAEPQVGFARARPDGRGAVPAIERLVGNAIVRYGARVEPRQLAYATIRGEAAALHDPYTVFFTPPEMKRFATALDGTPFGGIGIVVHVDAAAHGWHVDDVFAGSPAARAGVQAGDEIVTVDGAPVDAGDPDAPLRALRGAVGSAVRLGIVRAGVPLAAPLAIARASIVAPDVSARMAGPHVGYLALRSFPADAGDQVRAALKRLDAQGARALVFDLRGNGGGYESAAIRVADVFVAHGPLLTVEQRRGHRVTTDADGSALPPRPLAVLIDGNTASGAEIVAAAIRDGGLGTLVGARSYGKGLVQNVIPLPDGAGLKVTTARYLTAGGRDIDHAGIVPDLAVAQPPEAIAGVPGRDPQLDRALAQLGG